MKFEFPLTLVIEADSPMQAQERLADFERINQKYTTKHRSKSGDGGSSSTEQPTPGNIPGLVDVNAGYGNWGDVVRPMSEPTKKLPIGIALDDRGALAGVVHGGSSQLETN